MHLIIENYMIFVKKYIRRSFTSINLNKKKAGAPSRTPAIVKKDKN